MDEYGLQTAWYDYQRQTGYSAGAEPDDEFRFAYWAGYDKGRQEELDRWL